MLCRWQHLWITLIYKWPFKTMILYMQQQKYDYYFSARMQACCVMLGYFLDILRGHSRNLPETEWVITESFVTRICVAQNHSDVIQLKHFPRYWSFVRGIYQWIPGTKASDAELWCFLDLRQNKRLSKQWWGWWLETLSCSLWRNHGMISKLSIDIYVASHKTYIKMDAYCMRYTIQLLDMSSTWTYSPKRWTVTHSKRIWTYSKTCHSINHPTCLMTVMLSKSRDSYVI